MSATKVGMSRNTARRHLRQSTPLEQRPQSQTWRTRAGQLEAVWPRALEMLHTAPELEAGALFCHLLAAHPDRVSEKHRRTFQRRVRQRALGESVLSLRGCLNAVLGRLGRVPRELLTDHSSTATHQLSREGKRRGFNGEFPGICAHLGIDTNHGPGRSDARSGRGGTECGLSAKHA
jgi:hypothetical protein